MKLYSIVLILYTQDRFLNYEIPIKTYLILLCKRLYKWINNIIKIYKI